MKKMLVMRALKPNKLKEGMFLQYYISPASLRRIKAVTKTKKHVTLKFEESTPPHLNDYTEEANYTLPCELYILAYEEI